MGKLLKFSTIIIISFLPYSLPGFTKPMKSIYIEGYDRLKYSVEEIEALPGEQMQLTLKTVTDLPANQMAHNWVLLKKNANASEFINEGLDDKANDYIDPDFEELVIASTSMLAGGEKEMLSFRAPKEKGEYIYVCTFPGHFQAGMKGKLIVK